MKLHLSLTAAALLTGAIAHAQSQEEAAPPVPEHSASPADAPRDEYRGARNDGYRGDDRGDRYAGNVRGSDGNRPDSPFFVTGIGVTVEAGGGFGGFRPNRG